mmetsp:Transcript_1117/g.4186  ORF Transcript_1117/g.4186 Transcript_1117/m.4186 type:complete len:348 (+) Transcript_1117:168-1211(+)
MPRGSSTARCAPSAATTSRAAVASTRATTSSVSRASSDGPRSRPSARCARRASRSSNPRIWFLRSRSRGPPRAAPGRAAPKRSSSAYTSRTGTRCTRATASYPTGWTSRRSCAGGAATAATRTSSCSATAATRDFTATASAWTPCRWTSGAAPSARSRTTTTTGTSRRIIASNDDANRRRVKTNRREGTRPSPAGCREPRTRRRREPSETSSSPPRGNGRRCFVTHGVTHGVTHTAATTFACARWGPVAGRASDARTRTRRLRRMRMRMTVPLRGLALFDPRGNRTLDRGGNRRRRTVPQGARTRDDARRSRASRSFGGCGSGTGRAQSRSVATIPFQSTIRHNRTT